MKPKETATRLGISYPTLKKWIYSGKLRTVITPGEQHRVPETELERFIPRADIKSGPQGRRSFRRTSGGNQPVGRVIEVKVDDLMAQVRLSIAGQVITSIITADAVIKASTGKSAGATRV